MIKTTLVPGVAWPEVGVIAPVKRRKRAKPTKPQAKMVEFGRWKTVGDLFEAPKKVAK